MIGNENSVVPMRDHRNSMSRASAEADHVRSERS